MKKIYTYIKRIVQAVNLVFLALKTEGAGFSYVVALFYSVLNNSRSIQYLGTKFYYEDRLNPFTIFNYINELMEMSLICKFNGGRVLDVGGNVGIYGYTLIKLFPKSTVFSFEPNPVPFQILKKNATLNSNWKVFNQGISDHLEMKDIYFVEGKSGQGSFYQENADLDLAFEGKVTSLPVKVGPLNSQFLNDFMGGTHFNFVKIDTEGYESIVIRGLVDVTWDYMYVELSNERAGKKNLKKFMTEIQSIWPKAHLLKSINKGIVTDVWLKSNHYG